jgi:putative ABC transport system ATP-binding protein
MEKVIALQGIKKIYRKGELAIEALKEVTLSVEHGEFLAIMGPSGSGKSTLMAIIGCLDKQTEGTYILDGISTEKFTDDELSSIRNKKVGFIFQNFNLLQRYSAIKNVELPLLYRGMTSRERAQKALEALSVVGIEKRWNHKPSELSGGEMQRVAIARALIGQPRILLADEPTGNLDSRTGDEIIGLFRKLNESLMSTIIMVTHDERIAHAAKRIIRLFDGLVVEDIRN